MSVYFKYANFNCLQLRKTWHPHFLNERIIVFKLKFIAYSWTRKLFLLTLRRKLLKRRRNQRRESTNTGYFFSLNIKLIMIFYAVYIANKLGNDD